MYALSTMGSILGTFLPVALLIPEIGTRRTMLGSAALLALAAAPALGRRYMLAPVADRDDRADPAGRRSSPGSGIIYEGESAYQFIQVQKLLGRRARPAPERGLGRPLGVAPHQVLTGGYWDQFLLAPLLHGGPFRNLAMIGYAGGTVGRAYGAFWPARDASRASSSTRR